MIWIPKFPLYLEMHYKHPSERTHMTLPHNGSANVSGSVGLDAHGIVNSATIHWNLEWQDLYEIALRRKEGVLSAHNVLVAETGYRTGRSPNDKFIVKEEPVADNIWWGEINVPKPVSVFNGLRDKVRQYLSNRDELFVQDLHCGADPNERLQIRLVTENAWHACFARNMFLRPGIEEIKQHEPEFTILHAPQFTANPAVDGVNSEAFVMVSFDQKLVIIGGTRYAGEIHLLNHELSITDAWSSSHALLFEYHRREYCCFLWIVRDWENNVIR